MAFRSEFQPRRDDILLISFPKTGTTWLIALCHNILSLDDDEKEEVDVLAKMNPHELVPPLDVNFLSDQVQDLLLNPGRSNSGCKIVHVARNPKDTLVSMWHFYNKILKLSGPFPVERAAESFCSGVLPCGSFYEHVVGYWEESNKRPEEVLFLKYEELSRDPEEQVRKLASFMRRPFSSMEDGDAEVEKVLRRSSFNRLKELEVNKNGVWELHRLPNNTFFRKGTVGDWKCYLTPQMAKRIDQLTRLKLQGTGLSLDDF
ncbi:unnamed protein product [Linum tenue]|uniref:Sulfotransferase n=1 Tax=Linum tenue TaxID=586396 RepID=A0AAV0GZ37_9ROSI|nr:unnamed protein product [Linum tenue]